MTTQHEAWLASEIQRVDAEALAELEDPDAPMTPELFRRLRVAYWRRTRPAGRYVESVGGPGYLEAPVIPVTARAGQWILSRPGSDVATRWHMFTGDLRWNPNHGARPAALMCCGFVDNLWPGALVADEAPAAACRHCLGRVATGGRMPDASWLASAGPAS